MDSRTPITLPGVAPSRTKSVMSIDVEDWFQVENLKPAIPRASWDQLAPRVEANVDRMLELLDQHQARATFFTLGWVAERLPDLPRRIVENGHEIASHGYGHELIYELSEEAFRSDVERSKKLLEDLTGKSVLGYRAPNFSITDWAIPILQELGFTYDSSSFPTLAHDRYGKLSGTRPGEMITEIEPGFHELCVSCLFVGSRGLPWGGGGYFRVIPYEIFRRGVRRIHASGRPFVFYIHPWEIDAGQPRVSVRPRLNRFRHYVNLRRCEGRFSALLGDFEWTTCQDLLRDERLRATQRPVEIREKARAAKASTDRYRHPPPRRSHGA